MDGDQGTPTPQDADNGTPTPQTNDASAQTQGTGGAPAQDTGGGQPSGASDQGQSQVTTQSTGGGDTSSDEHGADGVKKTPWFQRRIDALTAEKWEERRKSEGLRVQTEALLGQIAELRKGGTPVQQGAAAGGSPQGTQAQGQGGTVQQPGQQSPQAQQLTEAEIDARANSKAETIMRERMFAKTCNDVYEAGKEEFEDFDKSLRTFQMVGGLPGALLETITEMPNAHKVLHALGRDAELVERVVKMPLTKAAMELARIEAGLSKPVARQVSSAPTPVRPVDGGSSRGENDPEKMSMEEFVAFREKQINARKGIRS